MTNPNHKLQELFVEFDDVYGGSTSYSLDYFPVIYDDVLELCEEIEKLAQRCSTRSPFVL